MSFFCLFLFLQIHFHGKDKKNLHEYYGTHALPKQYGGEIELPEGTGDALAELFKMYKKEFESK